MKDYGDEKREKATIISLLAVYSVKIFTIHEDNQVIIWQSICFYIYLFYYFPIYVFSKNYGLNTKSTISKH